MRKLKLRGLKDTSMLIQLVKIKGFKLRFDSAQSLFSPQSLGLWDPKTRSRECAWGRFQPFSSS